MLDKHVFCLIQILVCPLFGDQNIRKVCSKASLLVLVLVFFPYDQISMLLIRLLFVYQLHAIYTFPCDVDRRTVLILNGSVLSEYYFQNPAFIFFTILYYTPIYVVL